MARAKVLDALLQTTGGGVGQDEKQPHPSAAPEAMSVHIVQEPVVRRILVQGGQGPQHVVAARVVAQGKPDRGLHAHTLVRVSEACGQHVRSGHRGGDGTRHPADRRLGICGALHDSGERIRLPLALPGDSGERRSGDGMNGHPVVRYLAPWACTEVLRSASTCLQ